METCYAMDESSCSEEQSSHSQMILTQFYFLDFSFFWVDLGECGKR